MKQSQLFTKITKDTPKDEKSINSQLLIKAGFIDKLMAGGYSFLPLGFRVFKKIENIIREEMNKILGQEVLLPALHPKKNWEITNRWKYKEMFKLKSRGGKDYSLGWTHEEIITPLVKKFVKSYKDLPVFVFQIQDKFRDELRAKSGLLRAVEFIMKDLYSFHRNEKDLDEYYEKVKKAYFQIFKRCGLEKYTFLTLASGGAFSKYSHEFQTVTPFGEDEIYFCQKCKIAVNSEIIKKEKYQCPNCKSKKLEIEKAIEVGNIFKLKDKFSRAFSFNFRDENGKEKPVLMGCYGIGLGRLMGAIVEIYHDERGIIWPSQIAPFNCHLLALGSSKKKIERQIEKVSEKLYQDLQKAGLEVLYDDRKDKRAGEKFAEADLIGIPIRLVVSERTLEKDCVELKRRKEEKTKLIKLNQIINYVK
ncbi:His/Gly/Thr/Pro-type tRNA ligase C-terminal domain-containing protein [Patescibacteria group bacterium]|nr:His/Gly/Thr/Pro-type tRNA ligase C-terminal domain-containing protein [Patescibacteria group bacterium]